MFESDRTSLFHPDSGEKADKARKEVNSQIKIDPSRELMLEDSNKLSDEVRERIKDNVLSSILEINEPISISVKNIDRFVAEQTAISLGKVSIMSLQGQESSVIDYVDSNNYHSKIAWQFDPFPDLVNHLKKKSTAKLETLTTVGRGLDKEKIFGLLGEEAEKNKEYVRYRA